MTAIVENLTLRKNNFSKWFAGVMTLLSLLALYITLTEDKKDCWVAVVGVVMFGSIFYLSLRTEISVSQHGLLIKNFFKERDIRWEDITELKYESSYHGHGVSLVLTINYDLPTKTALIYVEQYRKKEMQRLFEILNEQCKFAEKNGHFIKQARGGMSWKDKLKMY
jgi:hypothetical protein